PLHVRQGEDRNWALRLKLIRDFGADKKWLTSPVQRANHTDASNGGIHVFIDFSNILIGFQKLLTQLNRLHPNQRAPLTNISFDSLVLLLERGRPVAKRVLAGSSGLAPSPPAFELAKAIGYDCNILDRVYKAKELTERQRRYKARAPSFGGQNSPEGGGSGMTAAGESPTHAPEKWMEQGVDEILHLKMMESLVDIEAPGSTMVLASGDAAEAEYSDGFLKMVERALKKGWNVEVVSWSELLSSQYKRRAWAQQWGGKFRVITLDDYAEFLLDT
ncbi:hypothetical protein NA57DRAFT_35257, partial [Rhizodiscina lignyota]